MDRSFKLVMAFAVAGAAWSAQAQTTWIEETFDNGTVGATVALGDDEPSNLVADSTWNPASSFESIPGTEGPTVEIVDQGSGDKGLRQNTTGDGIGDLYSPTLSVVDVRDNDLTIEFEVSTGGALTTGTRKMYVYAGRGAGTQFGWRAKVEQEDDKLEVEATVFPNAPASTLEAEVDFSLEVGAAIPAGGGTLAAGFQDNNTFRISLTFSSAGASSTDITCSVFDVTNNRVLRNGDTDSIPRGLANDRNLFDSALISFSDDQPGLVFDNLNITFEDTGVVEGEGEPEGVVEGEGEGDVGTGEDPEDVFTFWFEETFTDATLGTTRVMVDGENALSADNTWQPASSFEEAPGTNGPTVAITNGEDGLAIQQTTQGDGKGDLISPVLPVFDAQESKLSITLNVTTGAAPVDARKMYVYAGKAAGSQYGYRAKVEQKSDELVVEATLLPEAPSDNNEAEVSFSLADGSTIAGGGTLEAGFANNATFRITLVFDADPDDDRTEVECTIVDLTNDRILRDEDEDVIPIFLDAGRAQFNSAVLTFADDEPGLVVDNISLEFEAICEGCSGSSSSYLEPGETACLRVPDSFGQNDEYQWSKVGVGNLTEGRFIGVNCRSLQIPALQVSDSGTYQCSFGGAKAVYSTTLVVSSSLPVGGVAGLSVLTALIAGIAARRVRRN
jgi:hypothetical protein